MHKLFTRRLFSLALIVCALSMNAEKRSVYVLSDFSGWYAPTEANANHYEQFKIYETSEGSNIYEGIVENATGSNNASHYFRFKTQLSSETANYLWWYDNIAPFEDQVACEENGSIIIAKGAKYKAFASVEPGAWYIKDLKGCNSYKVTLDMNTGNVAIVLPSAPMVVVNAEAAPSPFEAADLIYSSGGKRFVEGVPLSFYLYDYYTDTKYGAASAADANLKENICWLQKEVDGQPWTVDGWTGGVLSFANGQVTLDCPDFPKEIDSVEIASGLWLVGGFSGWCFDDTYKMTADGDAYTGKLPAGATEFKITNQANWNGANLGFYSTLSPVGSTYYYILSSSILSANISNPFPNEEANLWFDPKSMVLAIWPASAGNREGDVPSDISYSKFEYNPTPGCLYVLDGSEPAIPTRENIKYLYRYLQSLQPDGNGWSGTLKLEKNAKIRLVNPETGQILCPGEENRNLTVGSGMAYSSYVNLPADQAAYWTVTREGQVDVTVKSTGASYDAVTVEYAQTRKCIYLVGNPSGWMSPTANNEAFFENWKLEETIDGGYYGAFNMPSAPMFRFYSSLSGWDNDSYGPVGGYGYDTPVNFADPFLNGSEFNCNMTPTKDSFSFPTWNGGNVYIYVAPRLSYVIMSENPMDVQLSPLDPDAGKIYYSIDNQEKQLLNQLADGRYTCYVYRDMKEHELRLYSSLLGVSPVEPEHLGSYAYKIASEDAALDNFDALGVAESKFGEVMGISSEDPGAFIIPALQPNDRSNSNVLVVDTNSGKVYFDNQNYAVISGTVNNNAVPTYENRADFYPYAIALGEYTIIDIPAGQFDFSFANPRYGILTINDRQVDVSFDQGGVFDSKKTESIYGLMDCRMKCNDWNGGKILFNGFGSFADLSQITSLSYYETDTMAVVNETFAGSKIFEFTTYPINGTEASSYLSMSLGKETTLPLRHRDILGLSNTTYSYQNPLLGRVVIADNKASVPLGCGHPLYFTQINGDVQIKVRVDLNTLTADISVIDGNVNASYSLFSDSESGSDEELIQSLTTPEVVFGSVEVASAPEETVEFNFGSSDGSVMVPAGDKKIVFNEAGFWTGDYATVQSTLQTRRRTATLSDKWSLPEGFSGKLIININQETNKITLNAPSENKGFLLLPQTFDENNYLETTLSAAKLDDYANKAMERDAEGNFVTTINDVKANGFVICKGIQRYTDGLGYGVCDGVFAREEGGTDIVLDNVSATADIPTGFWDSGIFSGNIFKYSVPENCGLKVVYDHALCELHLSVVELAGVEDIVADNDAPVEYYNLQGMRIANPISGKICIRRQGAKVEKIIVR